MAHETAILDFGSSKLTALVGERGVNNTINVKAFGYADYDGFSEGEWLKPQALGEAIKKALAEILTEYKIEHLYVGVPGEFTSVVTKEISLSLNKRRKIKEDDVDSLMAVGDNFDEANHEVIHIQPVYYTLDNERRVVRADGLVSKKLGGLLSYVLAERSFINTVGQYLSEMGITSVDYVSSVLAEALLIFPTERRDQMAVLMDVGYITTTVAIVKGDGLVALSSFSRGGGFIAGDLAEAMNISFSEGERLKRKVILSLSATDKDVYEIAGANGTLCLPAKDVNEVVKYRVRNIATAIDKCLKLQGIECPDYIPYSLTGGGISFIRGVKDVLADKLGRQIEIVAPPFPQVDKPNLSSAWGVLDLAINNDKPKKKGLFARLFK